jgi:hypothetical protein
VAEYEKRVRQLLSKHGCFFVRRGRPLTTLTLALKTVIDHGGCVSWL